MREFYTNAIEHERNKAQVQGKIIDFFLEAINNFNGLEALKECQYENPNYEEIVAALTSGRGVWNRNSQGEVNPIDYHNLDPNMKILVSCGGSKIHPYRSFNKGSS